MTKANMVWRGAVTGLSYYDYGAIIHRLKVGEALQISPVENIYDPKAVGIFYGANQVGWVPKSQNSEVRSLLDQGETLTAVITNHDPTKDFSSRLFINIYRSELGTSQECGLPEETNVKKVTVMKTDSNVATTSATTSASSFFLKLGQDNLSAAKTAGYLEAGRLANNQLTKALFKRLPMMVRGYADTPVGRLVTANIAAMALAHFRPEDRILAKLAEAAQVQAYQELLQNLEIEGFLDELMENSSMKAAIKKLRGSVEEADLS